MERDTIVPSYVAIRFFAEQLGQPGEYFEEILQQSAEIAEELGQAATTPDYSHDCYTFANQYLRNALRMTREAVPDKEHDFSYLVRCYQRSVSILEERIEASPALSEETTPVLLSILKEALNQLHISS